jgi:hypothetical protein
MNKVGHYIQMIGGFFLLLMIGTILYEIVYYLSNGFFINANVNFYLNKIGINLPYIYSGLLGLDKILNFFFGSKSSAPLTFMVLGIIFGYAGELIQKKK